MRKLSKKISFIALIFLFIFLVSCNKEEIEDLGEDYVEGKDYQYFFGSMPTVQKTEKGYYLLVNECLYYYDSSLQEAIPVCNKADCNHMGDSCNASMPGVSEINYYNHCFYYIASENDEKEEWFLCSLSEDGKQREKIKQIAVLEPSDRGISFQLCVHRGYAYFTISKVASMKKREVSINRLSLEKNSEWNVITKISGYGATIDDLSAYGNSLVVMSSYANASNDDFHSHTNIINIQTGKEEKDVLYDKDKEQIFCYMNRDNMYYYENGKVFAKNRKDGKLVQLNEKEKFYVECSSDGEKMYTNNWDDCHEKADYRKYGIDIFSIRGKWQEHVPMTENMTWLYGDSRYLFAADYEEDTCIYIWDKEHSKTSKGKWKCILKIEGDADGE